MNDKTDQAVTDALRGTAAGGHAVIINVPGCPLMVRAVDYNALRTQLAEAQRDAEVVKQINRACAELPDDFRIAIELERNAARVYLLQEDEDIGSYDPCDGIASSISAAIDAATGRE